MKIEEKKQKGLIYKREVIAKRTAFVAVKKILLASNSVEIKRISSNWLILDETLGMKQLKRKDSRLGPADATFITMVLILWYLE